MLRLQDLFAWDNILTWVNMLYAVYSRVVFANLQSQFFHPTCSGLPSTASLAYICQTAFKDIESKLASDQTAAQWPNAEELVRFWQFIT